jgi:dynein heavy chain
VPVIWLKPIQSKNFVKRHTYNCPVYKTSKRQGQLSTTGQSTNFILSVKVPMAPQDKKNHWIKRGCAMLTQLDY